jgi:hypothetical protein
MQNSGVKGLAGPLRLRHLRQFARIAQVIDLAGGVGAYRVGLMTN